MEHAVGRLETEGGGAVRKLLLPAYFLCICLLDLSHRSRFIYQVMGPNALITTSPKN